MFKKLALGITIILGLTSITSAQLESCLPGFCGAPPPVLCGGPPPPSCAESTTFLARTSGLDGTHTTAYTNLICGLVIDGVWPKFDVLYIYATQDVTTASLNLVSTNYTGTVHGAPTFTVDRGYAGVDGSLTVFIDTGFNPSVAPSPHFTQNLAHISVWNLTSAANAHAIMGAFNAGPTAHTYILPLWSGDGIKTYWRVNTSTAFPGDGSEISSRTGHLIAARSSGNTMGYHNGSLSNGPVSSSSVLVNQTIYALNANGPGDPNGPGSGGGSSQQASEISIGALLSSTDAPNFYCRLRIYMTAVGVP